MLAATTASTSTLRVDDEAIVNEPAARLYAGAVGKTTWWRWRQQFDDFPAPIVINGRNFYRIGEVRAWITRRASASEGAR